MRKNNLIFALMIICSITIDGCNANNNANCIINEDWVWNDGRRIGMGDLMRFGQSDFYYLKGDTIFYKGTPSAKITRVGKYCSFIEYKILKGGEFGSYININELSK